MAKAKKKVRRPADVVGVRFADNPVKIWHYLTRVSASIHLGMELVVHNHKGSSIAHVVQINQVSRAQLEAEGVELKWVRHKVAPL